MKAKLAFPLVFIASVMAFGGTAVVGQERASSQRQGLRPSLGTLRKLNVPSNSIWVERQGYAWVIFNCPQHVKFTIHDRSYFGGKPMVEHNKWTLDSARGDTQALKLVRFDNTIGEDRVVVPESTVDGGPVDVTVIQRGSAGGEWGAFPKTTSHVGGDYKIMVYIYTDERED